jgi:phosphoribosylanthranilate isomerase
MRNRNKFAAIVAGIAVATVSGVAYSASLKPQYILPVASGVEIKPLAYAADKITSTVVRGVPDGMGAYKNAAGDVTLLSVHEIPSYSPLAQLSKSSTSQWGVSITEFTYSTKSGKINSAKNFIQDIKYYNYNTGLYGDTPIGGAPAGTTKGLDWNISRVCSATLVQAGALAFKDG